jgi:hypothetical protein
LNNVFIVIASHKVWVGKQGPEEFPILLANVSNAFSAGLLSYLSIKAESVRSKDPLAKWCRTNTPYSTFEIGERETRSNLADVTFRWLEFAAWFFWCPRVTMAQYDSK